MKKFRPFLLALIVAVIPATLEAAVPLPIHATHDNGQGKSQDGSDHEALGSTAVAPEPETYLLFLIGLAVLGMWFRLSGRSPRMLE